ncbi:helix-turn-helix domain-containing protein [Pseudomonas sp. 22490]|uniref:helix-turn-helix domain-containing protein n=1 Tax=Pseudomonas sp. 22490 TaxID=3453929 RepID=UPI003F86CCE3
MKLGEKLRLMRNREKLTQPQMAELVGLSLDTLKNYELARRVDISGLALAKVASHPTFTKYTLWLMADQTAPEAGQISPV